MAHSRQAISAFRYGFGFGLGDQPVDANGLLEHLKPAQEGLPIATPMPTADRFALFNEFNFNRRARNRRKDGGEARLKATKATLNETKFQDFKRLLIRATYSRHSFRERLSWFWTDHFTTAANNTALVLIVPDMIDTAIRSNLG